MDQRHVGRPCWPLLHCSAERASSVLEISEVMSALGNIFPCSVCREHMKQRFPAYRESHKMSDPKTLMQGFHRFVSEAVKKDSGRALPSLPGPRRYAAMIESGAWRVYMVSFAYSVVANCTKMCKNVEGVDHDARVQEILRRLNHFLGLVCKCIGVSFSAIRMDRGGVCNTLMSRVYEWEALFLGVHAFGTFSQTRRLHLSSRVRSEFYDKMRVPSSLCKKCEGACEARCDGIAANLFGGRVKG